MGKKDTFKFGVVFSKFTTLKSLYLPQMRLQDPSYTSPTLPLYLLLFILLSAFLVTCEVLLIRRYYKRWRRGEIALEEEEADEIVKEYIICIERIH